MYTALTSINEKGVGNNTMKLDRHHLLAALIPCVVLIDAVTVSAQPTPEAGDSKSALSRAAEFTIEQLAEVPTIYFARWLSGDNGVAYVCDRSGAFELWHLPRGGEPQQMTKLSQIVVNPWGSPDGQTIVFGSDHGGDERYDLHRLNLADKKLATLFPTKNISETAHRFSPDGTTLAYEADPEIQFRPQLFIRNLVSGRERQLTKEATPVRGPIWSRNGKMLAAVRTGDHQHGDLLLVNVGDQSVKEVPPPADGHILSPFAFSPDDKSVLAKTKNADGFDQLALVDLASGAASRIGPSQWDAGRAVWHSAAGIFFTRNVSGRHGVYHLPSDDPAAAVREVIAPRGTIYDLDISRDGMHLLFVRTDSTQPTELYDYDLRENRLNQLTRSLPDRILPNNLSIAEPFKVESFDGTPIEGLIYRPKADRFDAPYPAIALIHGGPDSQSFDNFNPLVQALVQAGFVVVLPNYRGSTGYGKKFEDLNNKDWGGGDRKDVRAVMEHFIERGLVDRRRIGITGGSYGGYMTLIALTKDADFYAAGADSFGMHDLVDDYKLAKDRFGLWYETEMGTPETDADLFADRSPIRFLDRIRAPLIVFQGANDTNVPRDESDRMVEVLRKKRHNVEYVVYPDEGHGFTRRANRIDNMQKTVDFFRKHLK